jgi:hypothetical protein
MYHFFLVDCIAKDENPRIGWKEGLDSLKIALAAQ